MYNVNVVEREIAKGKEMLSRSFVNNDYAKQEIPSNLNKVEEKEYRCSLFTEYQQWINKVAQLGLSTVDSVVIYAEVKRAAYRGLARYRDGYEAPKVNVAEVEEVNPQVLELKALLEQALWEKEELKKEKLEERTKFMQFKTVSRLFAKKGIKTKLYQEIIAQVGEES